MQSIEKNHYVPLSAVIGKIPLSSSEIDGGISLLKNDNDNGEDDIVKLHKLIQEKYKNKIR